jgi:RNA polymerase sigma factor (sigma-70 family)
VYSIARQHDLAEDQCDDVAQFVFTQLLKYAGSIRDGAALPAWLAQTTRRACWKLVARLRRDDARLREMPHMAASDPAARDAAADAMLTATEQAHRVRAALDELGGRCRDLLRALFVESTSPDYDAMGRRLGMPVGSIGPTRVRCLAKLAALLEPQKATSDRKT